jgi:hypothetical protein
MNTGNVMAASIIVAPRAGVVRAGLMPNLESMPIRSERVCSEEY